MGDAMAIREQRRAAPRRPPHLSWWWQTGGLGVTVLPVTQPKGAPPAEDTPAQAGVGPLNYDALPGLEDVLLEDSFVREIAEEPGALRFTLMAALGLSHPFFQPPPSNVRHCFVPATLCFYEAVWRWHERSTLRFTDAIGAVDLGNIDAFTAPPEGGYRVGGDFGTIEITRSRAPVFTVLGASPGLRAYRRDSLLEWVKEGTSPARAGDAGAHPHPHDHE